MVTKTAKDIKGISKKYNVVAYFTDGSHHVVYTATRGAATSKMKEILKEQFIKVNIKNTDTDIYYPQHAVLYYAVEG